jgi:anti-sigma factor RsiW
MKAANDGLTPRLEVSDDELRRYADGRLSSARRAAVEGLLACNPDLAAQVMTQMHMRRRRQPERRPLAMAGAVLAVVVLGCAGSAMAGWAAALTRELDGWREADGDHPPAYVEDAAESRAATRIREAMASQMESPRLDPAEIQRAMDVRLPTLPARWRVVDVQVYPTDHGPSVNLLVEAPDGRRFDLFAVRADTLGNDSPEIAMRGKEVVAFWERHRSAYVLSGEGPRQELLREAAILAEGRTL